MYLSIYLFIYPEACQGFIFNRGRFNFKEGAEIFSFVRAKKVCPPPPTKKIPLGHNRQEEGHVLL